ncbi:hypothetical protein CHS0354_035083 [Potamilus streckersoni]|uniref:Cytochrome P450 n=1 Tax=Potamilus streckersoni TaxID=2493646 RepID=A0AAE0RXW9_9BIVA|nr:hypothetical protein CHS0354_035083 [Potamilus streckersoni]
MQLLASKGHTVFGLGIISTSGNIWKNQKKFILAALQNLGFGKSKLEEKIHMEVGLFLSHIESLNQTPFNMMSPIQTGVGNVISHLVFGGHFSHEDSRFKTLIDGLNSFIHYLSSGSVVTFMPILRFVPGDFFGVKIVSRKVQAVKRFVNELIEEHEKKFDEGNIDDFIDAFISGMKKQKDEENNIFTSKEIVYRQTQQFICLY